MVTSAELNLLTVKQLGALAKTLAVSGWHEMRKEELVRSLVSKSRSKSGGDLIRQCIASPNRKLPSGTPTKLSSGSKEKSPTASKKEKSPAPPAAHGKPGTKKAGAASEAGKSATVPQVVNRPSIKESMQLKRDLSSPAAIGVSDRLVLLVRDPFWLHAFWELNPKTVERAKVAMGHFWYTAVPVLRLYRIDSDGANHPRRHFVRDVQIHGGVNNWYLDVTNPPSFFQAELGYLSREKKFYSIVSSNTVETPQRQIVDELDKLDGNWRGVADDLGRIYKLSGGDANNQELRRVFEKQLRRPMSAPLLSRYRASQQGGGSEKTQRNFHFEVDADIIIHGKTDPSVQVTIRNEPIKVDDDGSFFVRFSIPEKRHVFPIEAEGSDGVETQRVILTVERNTRILETLFQEHTEED